ncbi:uncharacterized protein FYW49_017655 [Xenentodon cancila]
MKLHYHDNQLPGYHQLSAPPALHPTACPASFPAIYQSIHATSRASPPQNWQPAGVIRLPQMLRRCKRDEQAEVTQHPSERPTSLISNGRTFSPSERHLLTQWGGTAGVVNQAATVQGPATSQHQGLTITPLISPFSLISAHLCRNIFSRVSLKSTNKEKVNQ